MTNSIIAKNGAITTHGIMKVEFAIEGLTKQEVEMKLCELLNRKVDITMTDVNGEEVKLQTFGYSFEKLETFEADEF